MSEPSDQTEIEAFSQAVAGCDASTSLPHLWQCLSLGLDLLEQQLAANEAPSAVVLEGLLRLVMEALLPACGPQRDALQPLLATDLATLEQRYQDVDAEVLADGSASLAELHRLQLRLWFLHLLALGLDGVTPLPYEDLVAFLDGLRGQFAHAELEPRPELLHALNSISLEVLAQQGLRCADSALAQADSDGARSTAGDGDELGACALGLLRAQQQVRRLTTQLLDGIARGDDAPEGGAWPRAEALAHRALSSLQRAQSALMEATVAQVEALPEAAAQAWLRTHASVITDLANDTLSDIPDRRLDTQVPVLEQSYRLVKRFREGLLQARRKSLKSVWKPVRGAERKLRAEWVEAGISAAMARRFGPRFEHRLDLFVVVLVLAAIGILMVDLGGELSPTGRRNVVLLDTAICAGLLADFLLRLKLAPDRRDFFRRHALTDLLPAIPFAGIGLWVTSITTGTESLTALRVLRVVAVALRKARPLIQVARVFLFAARGMDRLVRRYRLLLNWDILFFEPRPLNPVESLRLRGDRLGRRIRARNKAILSELGADQRVALMDRNLMLARRLGHAIGRIDTPGMPPPPPPVARQIAVETVIERLTHTDPYEIAEVLGSDFDGRLKRLAWVAALPPLRWLPLFNDVLAARADAGTDLEFAEFLARRLGSRLQWLNDKVMFLSDMHGVITAPQFVDRIGNTLIQSMRRPRNRLLMLGAGFIVVTLLVEILPFDWLEAAAGWLRKTLGWPILILGLIAFVAVWFGTRLRNLAQTNTEFYTRIAEAKSINLLGDVKRAHAAADQAVLARRVLRPEARIQGREVSTTAPREDQRHDVTAHFRQLVIEVFGKDEEGIAGSLAERVYLLYRDYLRGAHFDRSNTHATDHLLGSPSLINLRNEVLRLDPAAQKALEDLDLRRQSGIGGPSLWLRFVTHAITQRVGQLVEEYNRHVVPIGERGADGLKVAELRRFEDWLARRRSDAPPPDSPVDLAADEKRQGSRTEALHYATSTFNALDFLSNDPARDRAIERRYGSEIVDLVRADRRRLIREVFGIPALHRRDPGQRSFNPYTLYQRYLSRGRVFMLPFALLGLLLRGLVLGFKWFLRILSELRHPELRSALPRPESFSDLRIALRKIHRMRQPVFLACTGLRARVDVEYLGLRLPGESVGTLEGSSVFEDLDMIGASPDERLVYQRLAAQHRQRMAGLQRFLQARGLLGDALEQRLASRFEHYPLHRRREVMRALSAACAANYANLSDLIDGPRRLADLIADAIRANGRQRTPGGLKRGIGRLLLRRQSRQAEAEFTAWWQRQGQGLVVTEVGTNADAARDLEQARRSVRRWWQADHRGIRHLIEVLGTLEQPPEEAAMELVERIIADTSDWSEQLVMLRTVQALTILDIRSTTHVVAGLGQYREAGEVPEVRVTMM